MTEPLNYYDLPNGVVLEFTSTKNSRIVARLAGPVFQGHSRPAVILEAQVDKAPRIYLCSVPKNTEAKYMANVYDAALPTISPGDVVYLINLDKTWYDSMPPCFEVGEVRIRG